MPLTIVVPGLCAHPADALAELPALRAFAAHVRAPAAMHEGLIAALFAALGLRTDSPAAALAASGAGADVGNDYVLAATPVSLVVGRDDIALAGRIADLDRADADAMIATLDRHFAEDGIRFFATRAGSWYARMAHAPDLATTPLDAALGRPIFPLLPRGGEARTWRRWQDELQMLLHEHAMNAGREARGLAAVNGVWLWGGGRLADLPALPSIIAAAATSDAGDVVRGLALRSGNTADALPDGLAATMTPDRSSHGVIVLEDAATADGLNRFATRWLAPAVARLERGTIDALRLVSDGHGCAVTWRASRPSAFARFAARFRQRRLEIPRPDKE